MKRIPSATYRLQFHRQFTFPCATEILDYLHELGISDVYASPLFRCPPQSTHGYDVCSFSQFNPALGRQADFDRFAATLKANNLGLLLDLVPNHMSATSANDWWMDVLEHGRDSKFAAFFDIDWRPADPALQNKVLLPVLEDDYDKVLKSGKLRLAFEAGEFFVAYHDQRFPVNRGSLAEPAHDVDGLLAAYNSRVGERRSFEKLDALLQRQHYRLADWRAAPEQINYRRFFDVTELVALRMELPEVFAAAHQHVFDLLRTGKITGLRIDHPDGLWDPKQYFERLQRDAGPVYVVAEKILSAGEELPAGWPVDGTTGYDFLNRINGLFIARANRSSLDTIYHDFAGGELSFAEISRRSKTRILEKSFAGELAALTRRLRAIAGRTARGDRFEFAELRNALREIIACFPVYRTYVDEASKELSTQDKAAVEEAVKKAKSNMGESAAIDFIAEVLLLNVADASQLTAARRFNVRLQQLTGPAAAKGIEDTAFYRFNRLVSLNEVGGDPEQFGTTIEEFHAANRATARHWPHTLTATSTHDTKRGEDVRARINVLSEMPGEWHDALIRWSKQNEPLRTSLNGSPAPAANDEYLFYQTLVGAWPADDTPAALAEFRERMAAFMLKAAKEAKLHTSWTEPNPVYEDALRTFVEQALAHDRESAFLHDLKSFQRRVAFFGRFNSLAQTLLKITCPGVPDFYQGSELWDLNLVDPDNRRPVDFPSRRSLLAALQHQWDTHAAPAEFLPALLRDELAGSMKLFLIWRALNCRRSHRDSFEQGEYLPLPAQGAKREHVCAFARITGAETVVVIVPRLIFGLVNGTETNPLGREVWRDTFIPVSNVKPCTAFENIFTREKVMAIEREGAPSIEVAEALEHFPVALLAPCSRDDGKGNERKRQGRG